MMTKRDTKQSEAFMEGFYEGNRAAWEKKLVCIPYNQYLKLIKQKPRVI